MSVGADEPVFSLQVVHLDGRLEVHLAGEIDIATAPDLERCLADYAGGQVRIDMAEVTFMDTSGINVLAQVAGAGTALTIRNAAPAIRRLFSLTGFDRLATIE